MSSSHPIFVQARALLARRWVKIFPALLLLFCAMPDRAVQGASPALQTFSISGKVTDGFGNPIGGAIVSLSGTQSGTTTSDDNGNYSFNNLPAGGNYTLSASKAGQYLGFSVVVSNLSSDQTVNLRLNSFVTISVHVSDASGKGLSGVTIKINNSSIGLVQTNANGDLNLSLSVASTGGFDPPITLTPQKPGYVFDPQSATVYSGGGNQIVNFKATASNVPVTYIQFSAPAFTVGEGDGSATITVTRTGETNSAVSVSYFTSDAGVATQKSDYTMAAGTLNFAPGETTKTFQVLITDNLYVQGVHSLFLQLANPTNGAFLGSQYFVTLSILDNDTAQPSTNPLDDAQFFVRQHYYDFLNRLPDNGGLAYWTSQFAECNSDADCLRSKRTGVSAAFFVEQEFQETGYVVYRLNRAALGLIPNYAHFMVDRSSLVGGPQLQQSTLDFTNRFVEGGAFKQFYPDTLTPEQFVNQLFDTAGLKPFTAERAQEIQDMTLSGKTRARVLLDVIELPAFKEREYNAAFVLMQYYGYLRRDPEPGGYAFWLNVLNNQEPGNYRGMVCSFITSAEYQQRFSAVTTHSNSECK
jgi:hypothetical protein